MQYASIFDFRADMQFVKYLAVGPVSAQTELNHYVVA